jgi:hypothetical protein
MVQVISDTVFVEISAFVCTETTYVRKTTYGRIIRPYGIHRNCVYIWDLRPTGSSINEFYSTAHTYFQQYFPCNKAIFLLFVVPSRDVEVLNCYNALFYALGI